MRIFYIGLTLVLSLFAASCGTEAPVGDAPFPPACTASTPEHCSPCEAAYLLSFNLVKTDGVTLAALIQAYVDSGNNPALIPPIVEQAQTMTGSCDQIFTNSPNVKCESLVDNVDTYFSTLMLVNACETAESLAG